VRVFDPDLALVLGEACGRGPEDRQVDVDQQPGIGADRLGVVAGRHHERMQAFGDLGRQARAAGGLPRPVGAARLVVVPMHVVDRVMEPERQRDFGRPLGAVAFARQVDQALAQVLQRVIRTLPFGVAGQQLGQQRIVGGRTERAPGIGPRRTQSDRVHRYCSIAARTSRPRSITDIA